MFIIVATFFEFLISLDNSVDQIISLYSLEYDIFVANINSSIHLEQCALCTVEKNCSIELFQLQNGLNIALFDVYVHLTVFYDDVYSLILIFDIILNNNCSLHLERCVIVFRYFLWGNGAIPVRWQN